MSGGERREREGERKGKVRDKNCQPVINDIHSIQTTCISYSEPYIIIKSIIHVMIFIALVSIPVIEMASYRDMAQHKGYIHVYIYIYYS